MSWTPHIRNLTAGEKVIQYYQSLDEEKRKHRFLKEPNLEDLKIHTITLWHLPDRDKNKKSNQYGESK